MAWRSSTRRFRTHLQILHVSYDQTILYGCGEKLSVGGIDGPRARVSECLRKVHFVLFAAD